MNFLKKTRTSSSSAHCFACGEDVLATGNYSLKILPAKQKRVPKKVEKILRKNHGSKSVQGIVETIPYRFKKYLTEKKSSSNTLEICCGVCKSISKIKMTKNDRPSSSLPSIRKASVTSTPTSTSKSKKKRRSKTPKDVNAGLIIPPSMMAADSSNTNQTQTPTYQQMSYSLSQRTRRSQNSNFKGAPVSSPLPNDGKHQKTNDKITTKESAKKTQLNILRKKLFRTKNISSSSGKSLQDFLS